MDTFLTFYVIFVFAHRGAEITVMTRTGTVARKPARDWTAWLNTVPYWLVVVAPALEYLTREFRRPSVVSLVLGAIFFALATGVRVRAHLDLGKQYATLVKEGRDRGLITSGIYAYVRHPLYLADVLLFLACPTFLGVAVSWIFAVIAIAGAVARVHYEEQFLRDAFEGYAPYAEKTWRLIPWVY